MGLLTVSNGGITPQRYGRVVAQTEEQLLEFQPEIDFVWGFVYGSSKRWLWFGGVWKVAQVLGKGAIATAPPPSASNFGALWVDEFGTAWQSNGVEWVVVFGTLTINGEAVTIDGEPVFYTIDSEILVDENGNILVDENNLILLEG